MGSDLSRELLAKYPDNKLQGRHRLALQWIDDNVDALLDAGCSYGYATRFYSAKAHRTVGIELDTEQVEVANKKYGDKAAFLISSADETPFANEEFDCIVMTDVLEHVPDRKKALNELCRILKPGGSVIITTPHKGLFQVFDPYNYGYYLKKYFGPLYQLLFKLVRLVKEGHFPKEVNPVHSEKHYHFSLRDFQDMIGDSSFGGRYTIERSLRSGLLIEPIQLNLFVFLNIFIGNRSIVTKLTKPFAWLSDKDYFIPYGPLGYNIALKIRKK